MLLGLGSRRGKEVHKPEMARCSALLMGHRGSMLEASVHRRLLFLINYLPPRTQCRPTKMWAVLLFNSCYKIGQHLTNCNPISSPSHRRKRIGLSGSHKLLA